MGNQNGIDRVETPYGARRLLPRRANANAPCFRLGYQALKSGRLRGSCRNSVQARERRLHRGRTSSVPQIPWGQDRVLNCRGVDPCWVLRNSSPWHDETCVLSGGTGASLGIIWVS